MLLTKKTKRVHFLPPSPLHHPTGPAYKRLTIMAEAPPPPLHTAAQPYSPGWSRWISVTMMREPDEPRAWPSATAPPRTLVLSAGRPRIWALASATAEKASLTSHLAMSAISRPAFLSAIGIAAEGAVPKSTGAHAASAKAGFANARHFTSAQPGRAATHERAGIQLTNDLGDRLESVLVNLGLGSQDKGRGTIVQVGRVGGSDGASL